jgi:hypothetical protein
MTVTSGKRSPRNQAKAMFDKFYLRDPKMGTLYKNRAAYTEIKKEYDGPDSGRSRDDIERAMAIIIERQVAKGVYLSRHLTGKAVDVRSVGLSAQDVRRIKEAVKREGGTVIEEGIPPHLHLQFD